jgi:hypothetical protein
LQAEVDEQRAQIDALEDYIVSLTGLLEQQSAQLVAQKKYSNNIGISNDLQAAYRSEVQALNQAKKFTGAAAPAAQSDVEIAQYAQVQTCVMYLYNFIHEINLFAKRGDAAVEESLATQIENGTKRDLVWRNLTMVSSLSHVSSFARAGNTINVTTIANPHIVANALMLYYQRKSTAYIPDADKYIAAAKGSRFEIRHAALRKYISPLSVVS